MEGETDSLSRIQEESCWSWSPTLLQLCSEQMWLRNLQKTKKQAAQLDRRASHTSSSGSETTEKQSEMKRQEHHYRKSTLKGRSVLQACLAMRWREAYNLSKLPSACHCQPSLQSCSWSLLCATMEHFIGHAFIPNWNKCKRKDLHSETRQHEWMRHICDLINKINAACIYSTLTADQIFCHDHTWTFDCQLPFSHFLTYVIQYFNVNVAISAVVWSVRLSEKHLYTFLISCFINNTEQHVEECAKIGEKDLVHLHKLTWIRNSDSLHRQQTANRNLQSSVSQLDHCENNHTPMS